MFLFQGARILRLIFRGCAHSLLDCISTSFCTQLDGEWWDVRKIKITTACIPMTHSDTCLTRKKKHIEGGKFPQPFSKIGPTLFCPHEYFGGEVFQKNPENTKNPSTIVSALTNRLPFAHPGATFVKSSGVSSNISSRAREAKAGKTLRASEGSERLGES